MRFRVVAVLALAQACGSFGQAEAPPADGGPTPTPTPAPQPEPQPHEAGADAPDGGPPRAGCLGAPLIEEHFDHGAPVPPGWEQRVAGDAAALTVDRTQGAPPPSLYATAPSTPDGGTERRVIARAVQLPLGAGLCIELDMRVSAKPGSYGTRAFSELVSVRPVTGDRTFVEMRSIGLSLVGNGQQVAVPELELGVWKRYVLRIPYGSAVTSLEVDGKKITLAAIQERTTDTVWIDLGVDSADGAGAIDAHLDAVRVTRMF